MEVEEDPQAADQEVHQVGAHQVEVEEKEAHQGVEASSLL